MEYGLGGNMRVNVVEEQQHSDSAVEKSRTTDTDDYKISLLELEIEDIALELEEEKRKSSAECAECRRHLADLEDAERELFRCQTDLQRSEQNLAEVRAQTEARDNNNNNNSEELADAEEELMRCRQHIEELEQQIEQMAEQYQQEVPAQSQGVRRDESASEVAKSLEEQHGLRNLISQQETSSPTKMNQVLQETLEKQTKLTFQIKRLKDQLKTLKREPKTSQAETDHKRKEIDLLRSGFQGSEQKKVKKEEDVRETETDLEKNLKMKDYMIQRFTMQVEELQTKAKRIPQLASQLSQLESLNAKLKSASRQKEKEFGDRNAKLESTLNAFETQIMNTKTQHERKIAELQASKDALKQDNNKTNKRAFELENQNAKLEQVIQVSEESNRVLKDEKKTLEERILQLEKVRAEQRSVFGIVFSVDLSGSLMGNSQLLAKAAFRTLIDNLRSQSPKAHVGVVVHGPSVYVARHMAEIDSYMSSILDSVACGGGEDYVQAFTHIVSLLSDFKYRHPKAKRRVIMISDGQGYSSSTDISTLCADRIQCHNIVVSGDGYHYMSSTQACSAKTGGKDFRYNGNFTSTVVAVLIGP